MNLIHTTDQLGNANQINFPPKKIVSLVPSQTEFLFDIGLNEEIKGITRFCIHPAEKVRDIAKIGGTKQLNIEKIIQLQPDLIIGNKEENERTQIQELEKHFPVWMSDIYTLDDACTMMREISRVVNYNSVGEFLINEIEISFQKLKPALIASSTAAYFIWRNPYMVAGANTFINDMMTRLGVINVFNNQPRYPEISTQTLIELKPDYIFLSSEPYRFTQNHIEEIKSICPESKVLLVDGEMFSWYGSRLKESAAYFAWLRNELGINLYK